MEQHSKNWQETARNAAYTVGMGAKKLTDAARRRWEIMQLEGAVEDGLQELGAMLYATHTGTPTDSDELLRKMEEIDSIKERLRVLEGDPVIHPVCPRCGHEVRPDDLFCGDCGEKL